METIPSVSKHLKQLDDFQTNSSFQHSRMDSFLVRRLQSLLFKFGGMGSVIFVNMTDIAYTNSRKLTESLIKLQVE